LACEEYLFLHKKEELFMIWQNANAIIVGLHQNTLSQINSEYVREKNIRVTRRMTGGGAVYHDLGNVNFTFIENYNGKSTNFDKYINRIVEFLNAEYGISAKYEGRNDIVVEGKKISGNSELIKNNRILHHGTLLFDADLEVVARSLDVNAAKFQDKAVDSIRKRVANITEFLEKPISVEKFMNDLMEYFKKSGLTEYELTDYDISETQKLFEEKYSTWEWNYGNSPNYNFHKTQRTSGGTFDIYLIVNSGIIENIKIKGDFFEISDISAIEKAITGANHSEDSLKKVLQNYKIEDYFFNVTIDEFINCII
jgi:lipoate-protein ligase A